MESKYHFCSAWFTQFLYGRMQTLEMLEKKEKVLLKKASSEVEKAKEFTRAKNKRGMSNLWKTLRNYLTYWIHF